MRCIKQEHADRPNLLKGVEGLALNAFNAGRRSTLAQLQAANERAERVRKELIETKLKSISLEAFDELLAAFRVERGKLQAAEKELAEEKLLSASIGEHRQKLELQVTELTKELAELKAAQIGVDDEQ